MDLSQQFQSQVPKTIQLELSGGGAHGAYECGALEVLMPFWEEKGYKIDLVTGVSAGAMNAVLLTSALNSGLQGRQALEKMSRFWDNLGQTGDVFLGPVLSLHSLASIFNPLASANDAFPNIPSPLMTTLSLTGKSSLPLIQLRDLLNKHISKEEWDAVRTGPTKTYIGTLRVEGNHREPVMFTGDALSAESVLTSAALKDFAPYRYKGDIYEDGGYYKIGFTIDDQNTDVIFAIGLKPLRDASEIENKRGIKTGQMHHDLARLYMNPARTAQIDFICMDPPPQWNDTSAMNNTSKNLNTLREMGHEDAIKWIAAHGATFGKVSSFRPSEALLKAASQVLPPSPVLQAA